MSSQPGALASRGRSRQTKSSKRYHYGRGNLAGTSIDNDQSRRRSVIGKNSQGFGREAPLDCSGLVLFYWQGPDKGGSGPVCQDIYPWEASREIQMVLLRRHPLSRVLGTSLIGNTSSFFEALMTPAPTLLGSLSTHHRLGAPEQQRGQQQSPRPGIMRRRAQRNTQPNATLTACRPVGRCEQEVLRPGALLSAHSEGPGRLASPWQLQPFAWCSGMIAARSCPSRVAARWSPKALSFSSHRESTGMLLNRSISGA